MARLKPCEWCNEEQFFRTEEDAKNVSGVLEIYPENGHMSVWFQGISDDGGLTHEESFTVPMNYCPNCGRKLVY